MTTDVFDQTRDQFLLPTGVVYLDGNSLGPLPKEARLRVAREVRTEWGDKLIRGWNESGWFDLPRTVGEKIARLIGAEPGTVVAGDSTSINLFKALNAALSLNAGRSVVLSDTGNFPTDLYVAEGALEAAARGHTLKIVPPGAVADAIDETVAVLMLTEVDYKTGRLHDMAALTEQAQAVGALTIWDLAHSAGALPVDLTEVNADFAVGCGYKYLNGGPGAPGFIYIRPDHAERITPILSGWLGHAAPFAFDLEYRPASGIDRMRVGTPPIISMSALDTALDVFNMVSMEAIRARSIALSERFIAEVEARCPDLSLASPRDPERRGSQASFRFENGYAAMRALIAKGVIGDFRAPDIMRFGFAPLYLSEDDIFTAAGVLEEVISDRLWDTPEFHKRMAVT